MDATHSSARPTQAYFVISDLRGFRLVKDACHTSMASAKRALRAAFGRVHTGAPVGESSNMTCVYATRADMAYGAATPIFGAGAFALITEHS